MFIVIMTIIINNDNELMIWKTQTLRKGPWDIIEHKKATPNIHQNNSVWQMNVHKSYSLKVWIRRKIQENYQNSLFAHKIHDNVVQWRDYGRVIPGAPWPCLDSGYKRWTQSVTNGGPNRPLETQPRRNNPGQVNTGNLVYENFIENCMQPSP